MLKTPKSFQPVVQNPVHIGETRIFLFHRGRVLLRTADMSLPGPDAGLSIDSETIHPVGVWQQKAYQTSWTNSDAVQHPEYSWHSLRSLLGVLDGEFLGVAGRAYQLAEWARTHRYCGACATPMQRSASDRSFVCPACGMTAYPRISPAMMVLIRKGEQVLLALHANTPYKRFTALAGFLEAGESVEEAIHREVQEEVGLKVHNLQYFGSQSWPFPHSLMLAFTADYLEGEIRVDPNEIAEARWFGPDDEWPERPADGAMVSIASALINAHRPPGK
jgi:NAD+ diphosphatase